MRGHEWMNDNQGLWQGKPEYSVVKDFLLFGDTQLFGYISISLFNMLWMNARDCWKRI